MRVADFLPGEHMTPVGVPVVFGLWFLQMGILLWLETSVVSRELQDYYYLRYVTQITVVLVCALVLLVVLAS